MKKILAFAGSNSSQSINHALIEYVADNIMEQEVEIIRLTDYEMPLFDVDSETETGYPLETRMLKNVIANYGALMISVNEHNGGPSAFFKNTIDWLSRLDRNFLEGKKILLMSTSTGRGGASFSLEYAKRVLPRFGAEILDDFSIPSFNHVFDVESNTITDEVLLLGLKEVVGNFEHAIEK